MRISVRNTPGHPDIRPGKIGLPPPPPPHAGHKPFPVFPRLSPAAFAVLLSLSLIFTACENLNNPVVTGVTVTPHTVSVSKNGTQLFTAVVEGTGGPSQTVTWTVEGNSDNGTGIDAGGLLSVAAGESSETLTVRAASAADPSKSGTATVTVSAPVVTGVTVSPQNDTLSKGGQRRFTAVVEGTGSPSQEVTWTVEGNSDSGTGIDDTGLLSVAAGENVGTLTVRAASTADPAKTGTAAVTVSADPLTVTGVTVTPQTISVFKGRTQLFTAEVTGTGGPPQTVTWTVEGNSDSGTRIDDTGLLSVAAGESSETLTVTAASTADPAKTGTAAVTVSAEPLAVTGVTVTPQTVSVFKGGTQLFTAEVTGTGGPSQEVTWTVEGKSDNGTGIDDNGLLSVAAGENAETLTVKAVSKADPTKSGTAAVTVTAAGTDPGAYPVVMEGRGYDTLEAAISAAAGTTAAITLMSDISLSSTITVSAPNTNITLTGSGTKRVVPGGETVDRSFTLAGSGVSLTLDTGVTLEGAGVWVNSGAALVLKTGAAITGVSDSPVWVFEGGTFTMKGGSISGNDAIMAGGVGNSGTFIMEGGSISGNTSSYDGGGVYNDGTFTMKGGSIEGNTASAPGGGVANSGTFIMEGGSISVNASNASNGGGVYNDGTFTMKGGSIEYNRATNLFGSTSSLGGAGVYNDEGGTFIMEGGSIEYNRTTNANGGGVYNDGTFRMERGSISSNTSTNGGGVYNAEGGTFTMESGSMESGSIEGNSASASLWTGTSDNKGGGVYNDGDFTMKDGSIGGNEASASVTGSLDGVTYARAYGGGVYNGEGGTFTMEGGSISPNEVFAEVRRGNSDSDAAYACGGGVYLDSGSAITKTGGTINAGGLSSSTGNTGGAAVYVDCTDTPVGLENDVKAEHNLTKAAADTTKSSLTAKNGWTDE